MLQCGEAYSEKACSTFSQENFTDEQDESDTPSAAQYNPNFDAYLPRVVSVKIEDLPREIKVDSDHMTTREMIRLWTTDIRATTINNVNRRNSSMSMESSRSNQQK